MNQIATIGHNRPPSEIDALKFALEANHADLLTRRDELISGVERAPAEVTDEFTAALYADFIDQIGKEAKAVDATHTTVKKPHLEAGRAVDAFFKAITDPLEVAHKTVKARQKKYLDAKADAERKARIEAERLAREAAEVAAKAARETEAAIQSDADLEKAVQVAEQAAVAHTAAVAAAHALAAKPAELSRVRGTAAVSSLKTFWTHTVTDVDAVPRQYLMVNVDAIKAAVKAAPKDGDKIALTIPGVRIYQDTRL